jgi:rod shape-determining protein MreD
MRREPRWRLSPQLPETSPNKVTVSYTSREQIEVYRFSPAVAVAIPLLAIFLQAFLPRWLPFFSTYIDLPLLVVIFFAMARRSQVSGLVTGACIGLVQDALTQHPLGVYGIAKTVVGYGASSLGVKLDVESVPTRLLVTTGFYVVHQIIYFTVVRALVGLNLGWSWQRELCSAAANALLGVLVFALMDRLKQRA